MASFSKFGNDLYTGARSFDIVGRRKVWCTIAAILVLAAVVVPIARNSWVFGIEFTGGSQFQISGVPNADQSLATDAVESVAPGSAPRVAVVGTDSVRVQTDLLAVSESDDVRDALAKAYDVTKDDVSTSLIGATWGADITSTAVRGLIIFIILAAVVMSLYFRTWKMSVAALVALIHDLIITAGVYGILGIEVTPAAVIGFLTILGYSLYDTVVVFDKIRENTSEDGESSSRSFAQSVNLAVNQTLVRSINTSVVAILPVGAILFIGSLLLGAGTLRDISLALFIGIIAGTYSTIFIAAPLYSHLREGEPQQQKREQKRTTRVTTGAVR